MAPTGTVTIPVSVVTSHWEGIPEGLIDGQNATFTIPYAPVGNTLNVYLNGLRLSARSGVQGYTRADRTLTLGTPPTEGDVLDATCGYVLL